MLLYIYQKENSLFVLFISKIQKIYENKSLIENDLNGIDFQKFQEFLDDNILKIEKI